MKIRNSVFAEQGGRGGHREIEALRILLQPDVEGHERVLGLLVEPHAHHADAAEVGSHTFQEIEDGAHSPPVGLRQFYRFGAGREAIQMERFTVVKEAYVGLVHGIKVIVELCHIFFLARYDAREANTAFWQGLPKFVFLEKSTGILNFGL